MSFLADSDEDCDYFSSFKEQVYEQLLRDCSEAPPTPSSGYVGKPSELSTTMPLFLIVDHFEQILPSGYEEKVVRLFAGVGHEERFVHLQGNWTRTKLSVGDPAFVIGQWKRSDEPNGLYRQKMSITVNDMDGYIIILPHVLIQGTKLAASQDCERKAYLMDLLPPHGTSVEMLKGTIVHELIQRLMFGLSSEDLEVALDNLLSNTQTMYDLYTIGHTPESFKEQCIIPTYMPLIRAIGQNLEMQKKSPPEDLLGPSTLATQLEQLPPYGCACLKEEESLWSFQWGMKGKIDVTIQQGDYLFPLELKSGSCPTGPRDGHLLQLAAYIFMMKEKYKEKAGQSGILFYAKNNASFKIEPRRQELQSIIIRRNKVAHAIAHGTVPETAGDSRRCQIRDMVLCDGQEACAFLEDAQPVKSPINKEIMRHLSYSPKPHHHTFYNTYEEGLLEEMSITQAAQTAIWLTPVRVRVAAGRALTEMKPVAFAASEIEFRVDESALSKSSVQPSSSVMLTRGGVPPIVGRGIVTLVKPDAVSIDMIESEIKEDDDDICLDLWESIKTIEICRSNLMSLFAGNADIADSRLRELVVDLEAPRFDPLPPPESINITGLNEDQMLAVRTVMSSKDYMLLLGMPGTGKTTTLASMIKSLADKGEKVLIASYTHTAVDNLCLKLIDLRVNFVRIGRAQAIHHDLEAYTLESLINRSESVEDISRLIGNCNIFASTCLGFHHPLVSTRIFDTCVVDEASQINVPTVLGPLSRAKRFVLVGDHYQLSPLKRYGEQMNADTASLFRILCEAHPSAVVTLRTQYRMNNEILRVCNELIYDFRMRTGSSFVGHKRLRIPRPEIIGEFDEYHRRWLEAVINPDPPVLVVNTDDVKMMEAKGSGSKLNHGEAAIVASVAITLVLCGIQPEEIGIISPYRAQVLYVRDAIVKFLQAMQRFYPHLIKDVKELATQIECHTVDKFQGRDKEVILFSAVKSNRKYKPGNHVTVWQRLNVSVTRAKTKFILVGSVLTLGNSPFFSRMFSMVGDQAIYRLPNELDQVNTHPFTIMSQVANPFE